MNYKKILKRAFVGLTFYGIAELAYQAGKGTILGVLSYHDITATDAITNLSGYDKAPFRTKVVLGSCKIQQEHLSKKES